MKTQFATHNCRFRDLSNNQLRTLPPEVFSNSNGITGPVSNFRKTSNGKPSGSRYVTNGAWSLNYIDSCDARLISLFCLSVRNF